MDTCIKHKGNYSNTWKCKCSVNLPLTESLKCTWHHLPKLNCEVDEKQLTQFSSALGRGLGKMKLKLGLPNLLSFTLIWSQQAFCLQFHHLSLWVNAAIHWQYDLVYKVIPDPICGNVSSVACLVIADQFGKICKTAKITFSPMCQLLSGVQNNRNYPLQQRAHLMLLTVKALYPLQGTGVKSERKKYCLIVRKPWYIWATSKWLD